MKVNGINGPFVQASREYDALLLLELDGADFLCSPCYRCPGEVFIVPTGKELASTDSRCGRVAFAYVRAHLRFFTSVHIFRYSLMFPNVLRIQLFEFLNKVS
jgi:hypothetical protein